MSGGDVADGGDAAVVSPWVGESVDVCGTVEATGDTDPENVVDNSGPEDGAGEKIVGKFVGKAVTGWAVTDDVGALVGVPDSSVGE